jgi:hypothetical protein
MSIDIMLIEYISFFVISQRTEMRKNPTFKWSIFFYLFHLLLSSSIHSNSRYFSIVLLFHFDSFMSDNQIKSKANEYETSSSLE